MFVTNKIYRPTCLYSHAGTYRQPLFLGWFVETMPTVSRQGQKPIKLVNKKNDPLVLTPTSLHTRGDCLRSYVTLVITLTRQHELWFYHYDFRTSKLCPYYWPFVRGIHRWPLDSPHNGSVKRSFDIFFTVCLNKLMNKQWSCRHNDGQYPIITSHYGSYIRSAYCYSRHYTFTRQQAHELWFH